MEKEDGVKESDNSVANRVLKTFIDSVAEEEKLQDVADRLSSVLLGSSPITEAALREALFNETDS